MKDSHAVQQNIHLVVKWLGTLEKLLEEHSKGSHPDYRVFISAEPAPTPEEHIIPQGILQNSIKIINEPPTGLLANFHAALYNFDQVRIACTSIFLLCCFVNLSQYKRLRYVAAPGSLFQDGPLRATDK